MRRQGALRAWLAAYAAATATNAAYSTILDAATPGGGSHVSPATGSWLGALFESLVAQTVRIYADAAMSKVGHLRTKEGNHEIDLIVEAPARR